MRYARQSKTGPVIPDCSFEETALRRRAHRRKRSLDHPPSEPDAETRPPPETKRPDSPTTDDPEHLITITRQPAAPKMTTRVGQVCRQFGIPPQPGPIRIVENLSLNFKPGTITLISGPSGSGKSTILQAIEQRGPRAHAVHRAALPINKSIVDAIGTRRELADTLQLLTACALGEPRLWLRSYDQLSDGEQFRAKLARCIDLHLHDGPAQRVGPASPAGLLLGDEFCAMLHRRVARAIAYNLRKLTTRLRLTLVLATSNTDLLADLQPDQHVQLNSAPAEPGEPAARAPELTYRQPKKKPISFRRNLIVERGGKRDYHHFKPMHYRQTDELGFVDCVFVLRDKSSGEKLAIVVYSHPPLELSLRNKALDGRFKRNAKLLNKEMRILRRLVVHPDVRGCGLGHYLVRKTLPMVDVPFVECLASMGSVTPVFEKAGMERIGECPMPTNRAKLLKELQALGADPFGPDFVNQVCRRPRVRNVVAKLVYQWYQATTGQGEKRVAKQSPEFLAQAFRGLVGTQPVYYLWQRTS